jgi:hypothetical protein
MGSCSNAAPLLEVKGETKMACVDFLLLAVIPVVSLYMMIERFRYSQKKNERFRKSQEKIRPVLVQC